MDFFPSREARVRIYLHSEQGYEIRIWNTGFLWGPFRVTRGDGDKAGNFSGRS